MRADDVSASIPHLRNPPLARVIIPIHKAHVRCHCSQDGRAGVEKLVYKPFDVRCAFNELEAVMLKLKDASLLLA